MRICIYGAGAIGGFLGARLAGAGADVSLIARGDHLAAIRDRGLVLRTGDGEQTHSLPATDDPGDLGYQDYVIVTLKAHAGPASAAAMQPLLGPETAVVTAVNGIPWWYFHESGGAQEGLRLESVDPGGRQWEMIGPERAIGCVVYAAAEVVAPGVVLHTFGDRFVLGEPGGAETPRLSALQEIMRRADLDAPIQPRIRDEIWLKLWGNISFNPISALTTGTMGAIAADPGARDVTRRIMAEAQCVGEKLGVTFTMSIEDRIDMAAKLGDHKTSMLQDLERGRPLEIDAMVTVVQEMGRMTGVATPTIDAVLALVRQRAAAANGTPGPGDAE